MSTVFFIGEHPKTFEVQRHAHDYWELVYCTGGRGRFELEDGAAVPYQEGDAVAIPPGERHANTSDEGFTNIHVQLSNPPFPFRTAFRVADNSEGHLRAAFTQMLFYGQAEIERGGLILSALGDLIASYMLAYRDCARFSPPVEKLRSVIIWNYADPGFALDQAIRALPFHYDYLRKIFKRETGQTPLEYMTRLRMKKAERMLSGMPDMDFSVAEIAALCGYDNPLYFSRVFKKHFGASPTAYAGGRRRGNMSVL